MFKCFHISESDVSLAIFFKNKYRCWILGNILLLTMLISRNMLNYYSNFVIFILMWSMILCYSSEYYIRTLESIKTIYKKCLIKIFRNECSDANILQTY